jgi:CHASE3 domain sensor protein
MPQHEMFTVHNSLKSTINLLEAAEVEAEKRITSLEDKLNEDITRALEARMAALEAQVHRSVAKSVHSRISSVERGMSDRMEDTMQQTVTSATKAWRTPFYLLVGLVGAMSIMSYFKYRELRKEHLL